MTAIFLSPACQTVPEPAPAEPEVIAEQSAVGIDPELLQTLLDAAEQAIRQENLTYPAENNAQYFYQQVLALEPEQPAALRGLERIVELYIEQSMQALNQARFAAARSMLSRARLINPNHPSIEPTAVQIRLLSNADKKVVKLNQADLLAANEHLRQDLARLGQIKADEQCRFTISAKNDRQGRWIYQQLSQGSPERRIRAQITLRLPAGVEKTCFNTE